MRVFVSYTRSKDAYEAVTQFCEHFAQELGLLVPGSTVFQDKTIIRPGDPFSDKIADELGDADVLLVLVSPAWLASAWCRKEFELFSAHQATSGRRPCVLPILWVKTPALQSAMGDPIARKLAELHYDDWRELRHKTWNDSDLLLRVARLAEVAVTMLPEQKREVGQIGGEKSPTS
jgi:hypothetical protein